MSALPSGNLSTLAPFLSSMKTVLTHEHEEKDDKRQQNIDRKKMTLCFDR